MSKDWQKVSVQKPCTICGRPDWCTVGLKGANCMRTPSPYPCRDRNGNATGGHFHPFGEDSKCKPEVYKNEEPEIKIDAARMIKLWRDRTRASQICKLANELGVSPEPLFDIGAAWSNLHDAWAFPMKDGNGETVGIRLRWNDGRKKAVLGSKQGIFYSAEIPSPLPWHAILVEGATDCAAAASLGLYAIGRPSNMCGGEDIRVLLARLEIYRAIIVADNDGEKELPTGKRFTPGFDGAAKLANEIKVKSVVWTSQFKDMREFKNNGGTAQQIEQDVKNMIWRMK